MSDTIGHDGIDEEEAATRAFGSAAGIQEAPSNALVIPDGASMSDTTWREIDKDTELYKFYMELLLKGGAFTFTITGGIASYYFANTDKPHLVWSLLLPVVLNIGFCSVCVGSIGPARLMHEDHKSTCARLGFANPYDLSPLYHLLVIFSVVFGVVAAGLMALLVLKAR